MSASDALSMFSSKGRLDAAALIAKQPPGRSLLQEMYADPAIFQREVDRMFMRHWLCVGHESSLPSVGDYFLFNIASESAIIVRGQDTRVHALVNVCRHRGSRVCMHEAGNAKLFVCPYHGWAYNLDGSLNAARHPSEDFDPAAYGLRQLRVSILEGLIFVSFADNPLGLGQARETLQACLAPYGWGEAKVARRKFYTIAGNWKLAVENYVECYHCGPAHPEFAVHHAAEQPRPRVAELNKRTEQRMMALGVDIRPRDLWALNAAPGEEASYCSRASFYGDAVTGSPDGRPVAPLMGQFGDYDGGQTYIYIGPASFFLAYADYGVVYRFTPRAEQITDMEVIWLVRKDAQEGIDFDLERLTWLWTVTSDEDQFIIENNQLGVNSRFYRPGPYMAAMEELTHRFTEWCMREIACD